VSTNYISRLVRVGYEIQAADARDEDTGPAERAFAELRAEALAAGVDADLMSWALEMHGHRAARDAGTQGLADEVRALRSQTGAGAR
jgi:hypothetical protein